MFINRSQKLLIFVVTIIFVSSFTQIYSEDFFSTEIKNLPGESYRAQILLHDETILLTWTQKINENAEIYFSKSTDGGKSFSEPINLSNNTGSSAFPRLSADGKNVYVVWYDYSPGQSEIFLATSRNGGIDFDIEQITNNTSASYNPWISSHNGQGFIVWNDGGRSQLVDFPGGEKRLVDVIFGNMEILFVKKTIDKITAYVNVSNSEEASVNPRMQIDGDNIFIVWNENNNEVFFSKSHDAGDSFSKPVNLSKTISFSDNSAIAVSGEHVFVVWPETFQKSVGLMFTKSNDYGNSFSNPILITDGIGKSSIVRDGSVSISGNNVYLSYTKEINGISNAFLLISQNLGESFEHDLRLSNDGGRTEFTQVASNERNVFVTWMDYSLGESEVFLRESNDEGITFSAIRNISNDNHPSSLSILGPQIYAATKNTFIVFENKTNDSGYLVLSKFDNTTPKTNLEFSEISVDFQLNSTRPTLDEQTIFLSFSNNDGKITSNLSYTLQIHDEKRNLVLTETKKTDNFGKSNHTIAFPFKGTFYASVIFNQDSLPPEKEFSNVIINVIPEFPVVFLLFTLSFFFVLFLSTKYFNGLKISL